MQCGWKALLIFDLFDGMGIFDECSVRSRSRNGNVCDLLRNGAGYLTLPCLVDNLQATYLTEQPKKGKSNIDLLVITAPYCQNLSLGKQKYCRGHVRTKCVNMILLSLSLQTTYSLAIGKNASVNAPNATGIVQFWPPNSEV